MTSSDDLGIPSALILPFQATDCHFILQAVIRAIHEAIKKLPNDIDFSNPTLFAKLPFPSTLRILAQQFEWSEQDNISYFQYMGRSKFNDLLERMQGKNFIAGFERIYLYGSSGCTVLLVPGSLISSPHLCAISFASRSGSYMCRIAPSFSRTSMERFRSDGLLHATNRSHFSRRYNRPAVLMI